MAEVLPAYGIEIAESRFETLLGDLPHIRSVEINVRPTQKPPTAVLGFSFPNSRQLYTGGVGEVEFRYFLDLYYTLDNARTAAMQMREDVLALIRAVEADPSLDGSCEEVEVRDGGRPLYNANQLVKPLEVSIKTEEA